VGCGTADRGMPRSHTLLSFEGASAARLDETLPAVRVHDPGRRSGGSARPQTTRLVREGGRPGTGLGTLRTT